MSSLLAQPGKPTAVIGYNDIMALGALYAIRKHGLCVPDDISFIVFSSFITEECPNIFS